MKKFRIMLVPLLCSAAVACAVARTDVAALEASLTAVEAAAMVYVSLPLCPAGAPLCSDVGVLGKLKVADNVAYAAVVRARGAVNDPRATQGTINAAIAAAAATIGAYRDIISALPTRARP